LQLLRDIRIQQVAHRLSAILLYRVLDRFFGRADLLGVAVASQEADARPIPGIPLTADWGFALEIAPGLVGEVRSVDRNSRHLVRLWASDADAQRQERTLPKWDKFLSDLRNAFESNRHLFDEKTDLQQSAAISGLSTSPAVINVAFEKYQAAVRLLDVASALFGSEEPAGLSEPSAPEGMNESLLLGSATLFVISFEGFLNLIYSILLRDDLADKRYERLLTRSDLDLRVSSLHVFCRGFARQPIPIGSELWSEINHLREFRNDLLHGNVTDEHELHTIPEGPFIFYYAPFRDYRGPNRERRTRERLRRYTAEIDRDFVGRIRSIVDRSQGAIIESLEPKLQTWALDLLEQEVVTRPLFP
jgi:hypothetical protein